MALLLGTAGHVDHGKTSLIKILTGIDADRLAEEKKRGMTLDLGFAYLDLPGMPRISIVDVPGHQKYLHNMLVGALGIDVALLVVAANDGVKPQTIEHVQILNLTRCSKMVVAVTKIDIVDSETIELACQEIRELLAGTRFADAPIVPLSCRTEVGVDLLKESIKSAFQTVPIGENEPWNLPIDRVFTVKGHGTVVTGTLTRGEIKVGDELEVQPGGLKSKVKGLHCHGESQHSAERGTRVAINLQGIDQNQVERGQVCGIPGSIFETNQFSSSMKWLLQPKIGSRVRVSIGSDEIIGRVYFTEGDEGAVRLKLERTTGVAVAQPFILRRYSPPHLLGGGAVVDPLDQSAISHVSTSIREIVEMTEFGCNTERISRLLSKTTQALGDELELEKKAQTLISFGGWWMTPAQYESSTQKLVVLLTDFHAKQPRVALAPRASIASELKLPLADKQFSRWLEAAAEKGIIRLEKNGIALAQFTVQLNAKQHELLETILQRLNRDFLILPSETELATELKVPIFAVREILSLGEQSRKLVRITNEILMPTEMLERAKLLTKKLDEGSGFTAAQFRDASESSRKTVIPLLEYFDAQQFTVRLGDVRKVR